MKYGIRLVTALWLLIVVNLSTQVVLNVLLNVINYNSGQFAFVGYYILLEVTVVVLEAVLYSLLMKRYAPKERTA